MIHGTNQTRELPKERRTLQQQRAAEQRERLARSAAYKVPQLCPGGTVVCLGAGPSLQRSDIEYAEARGATLIAVNDAYLLAPKAAALMASDGAWWVHKKPEFAGLRFCLDPAAARVKGVVVLQNTGTDGLELNPSGLKTGRNSGAAALNLAVHFGAKRILLLGYDMGVEARKKTHFFGNHKFPLRDGSPYPLFREQFAKMIDPFRQLGIEVVNCSRRTELRCFPCRPLEIALP